MIFIYFIVFIVLRSTPGIKCAPSSSNPPGYDKIDHVQFLTHDFSKHYLNKRLSDVVLLVDNEEFHAHRFVLALHSEYFRVLLYGEHKESREVNVPINEASANAFKAFLEYIYTGRMDLSKIEGRDIVEIVRFSDSFGFPKLQLPLAEYLRRNIDVDNVCSLLTVARLHELKRLEDESLNFIDIHALDVLESEDSLSLSSETLQQVLNRDTAYANELDIFHAVCRWTKKNQDRIGPNAKTQILSAVRYQLMLEEELSEVRRSELVRSDTIILDVIKSKTESLPHELDYRGQLEPNVNFVERAPNKPSHIQGSSMIMLDRPSNINYIKMLVFDPFFKTYSYYIEVSIDGYRWLRVIDYSNYDCHFTQSLWIHRRFVQYIRIVGTKNSIEKFIFFKIMYNTDMHLMEIKNGLVAPKYNVALISMSAFVIQGLSNMHDSTNVLLDGEYKKYDKNKGFAYHLLGSEAIMVQLSQPYVLGSMRLLLWDCDSRTFGYTIEVSIDNLEWDIIGDKSDEAARSWQFFEFDPRPIVYIRITGVHTSKNDGRFMCVHLEAPAQERTDTNIEPTQQRSILRLFKPTHIRN